MCQVWSITDTPGAVSKKKSINVFRYAATATGLSTGVINGKTIHLLLKYLVQECVMCQMELGISIYRHVFLLLLLVGIETE